MKFEMITIEDVDVLSDKKIPLDKLTGIATNRAAVMTNKKIRCCTVVEGHLSYHTIYSLYISQVGP